MTTQEKLLLIEKARVEFEKLIKDALGVDGVSVSVSVYSGAKLFDSAPAEWIHDGVGDTVWATSKNGTSGCSVFGIVEAQS